SAEDARHQAARAEALTLFLQNMVAPSDPAAARGGSVTLREILDRTSNDLAHGAFADHPDLQAAARRTIGNAYPALGMHAAAEKQLREVLTFRKKTFGERSVDVAVSLNDLAALMRDDGKLDDAEQLSRQALAIARDVLGEKHITVAAIQN